jgi:hypothetical protein
VIITELKEQSHKSAVPFFRLAKPRMEVCMEHIILPLGPEGQAVME